MPTNSQSASALSLVNRASALVAKSATSSISRASNNINIFKIVALSNLRFQYAASRVDDLIIARFLEYSDHCVAGEAAHVHLGWPIFIGKSREGDSTTASWYKLSDVGLLDEIQRR